MRAPRGRCGGSLLGLIAAAALLAPACGGAGSDAGPEVRVEVSVSPDPPSAGPSELLFTLRDAAGAPVAGAAVHVEATMSHAGMVPEFADAAELEPGRYRAALEFTMGGDWILIVDVELAGGGALQRTLHVRGVDPKRAG